MIEQAQELTQLFFFLSFLFFFSMDIFPSLFQENLFLHSLFSAFTSLTCFNLVPALRLATLVTPVRARVGSAGGLLLLPQALAHAGRDAAWHPATPNSVICG